LGKNFRRTLDGVDCFTMAEKDERSKQQNDYEQTAFFTVPFFFDLRILFGLCRGRCGAGLRFARVSHGQ
jgi:hypothetical protein